MGTYYLEATPQHGTFEELKQRVTDALKAEGFGVITEIDFQATLQQKLGVSTEKYTVLGACAPAFAHLALQNEPFIGLLLPCNVLIKALPEGGFSVAAVDPLVSLSAVGNEALMPLAQEVRTKLQRALAALG
jgi:uncharacterized protein (DUF302 family)